MTAHRTARLALAAHLASLSACALTGSPGEDEVVATDDGALRALEPAEIVGTLAYGATSAPVAYTRTPTYRAFAFTGKKGESVEAWARSSDGDARAWLLAPSFATLASNRDASPGVRDSKVTATLPESGTFYVVFREEARRDATFTVSLALVGGTCALAPAITAKWEDGEGGRPFGPMVFDAKRNRLVTFSDQGTSELTASGWSPPTGDPIPAGHRNGAAIAYDSDRGRAVLFGGGGTASGLVGDTWEWDGARWTQMKPAGFTPRARRGHALVYDAARKVTMLYGGIAGNSDVDLMEDTWTWDGAAWMRVATKDAPHPEPRTSLHMAFDAARGKVVLFGQYGGWYVGGIGQDNYAYGNTWEWDGAKWTAASGGGVGFYSGQSTETPMAFDASLGRVVRAGLVKTKYGSHFTLLSWSGSSWDDITRGAIGPKAGGASSFGYSGTYDPLRRRFVLGSSGYDWRTKEFFLFEEPNRAPTLDKPENQRAFAGEPLSFTLSARDADGHSVRFAVSPLPGGAAFDSESGRFTWTPTAADAGVHKLVATATDGCDSASFPLEIKVEHLSYAKLPTGAMRIGGEVQIYSASVVAPETTQKHYSASPKLACTVSGQNPGKLTVACAGMQTQAWAYQSASYWFTPATLTAPLEADLRFSKKANLGDTRTAEALEGFLEPLSDGTYKLWIRTWAAPIDGKGARVGKPASSEPSYGILDVIP